MMPAANGACPTFGNGHRHRERGGGSIQPQVWAGTSASPGGMLTLYRHRTGSSPGGEVPIAFDTNAVTSAEGPSWAYREQPNRHDRWQHG
jgi:hypothetical protein